MWRGLRVAVVIPAFDEAALIARTLRGVPSYVDRVFVVDDASTDETWRELGVGPKARLVRIRHARNRGVGAAISTGYRYALASGADAMAVMAGDDQMRPDDLCTLLDALVDTGADYAKGNRLLHPEARRMPWERRLGSRVLSWLTRRATGLSVRDCQCGYTVIRAAAAAALPLEELWPRYGYPNDLLALLAHSGATVVEVPVTPVYAGEQSGLHAGHMFTIAAQILRRDRQLRRRWSTPQSASTWP